MKTCDDINKLLLRGEKIDMECKEAAFQIPRSIYETYSSFANTYGGTILLGIREAKSESDSESRFVVAGVMDSDKIISDFWNTINSDKVSANILLDDNVYPVEVNGNTVIVIEVPRADYLTRPVYTGENPFKGTFKRNHEGDYHCSKSEVNAMIRDEYEDGNDGLLDQPCEAIVFDGKLVIVNFDWPFGDIAE